VNLNSLFSTIEITYPAIENGSLMTDDWKWILRTASATRPILRFADPPPWQDSTAPGQSERSAVFSDMRGMLTVSAGQGTLATAVGNQAGLGTAFALAASFLGTSQLQVSGNVGGSQSGIPAAAFRTSYSHELAGGTPEVSVTMRQLYMPGHFAAALAGQDSAVPALRTMSVAFDDHAQIDDNVTIQYGFALDCVSFLEHLNYLSPYVRLSYDLGNGSELEFAYISGNGRPDLSAPATEQQEQDLQRDLDSLALYPRISMLNGQSKVQRGEEYEVGYSRKVGSRTYNVSAYRESVSNLALTMVSPAGYFTGADVLPDLFSNNSIFNAGTFGSVGYSGAVTQNFGDNVSATAIYGSMGALTTDGHELVSNSPDELRSMIRAGRRQAATTRITVASPWTGTHLVASYQWALGSNQRWLEPGSLYGTSTLRTQPGLNIHVRQPIPGFGGRIEATADLRNLLAQGYLGLNIPQNQRVLLVENPRSIRGGLSFIF